MKAKGRPSKTPGRKRIRATDVAHPPYPKAHPLTLGYLVRACLRPGMYMREYELHDLELQLHGYDAALAEIGSLNRHVHLNDLLSGWIERRTRQSLCLGWAAALERRYGPGELAFKALVSVVKNKLQPPGSEQL